MNKINKIQLGRLREATCLSLCVCLSVLHCLSLVEDGLSPAFIWREGPQTVTDGSVERSRIDAEVQQLQARTVELAVHWAQSGGSQRLGQLKRGHQKQCQTGIHPLPQSRTVRNATTRRHTEYLEYLLTGMRWSQGRLKARAIDTPISYLVICSLDEKWKVPLIDGSCNKVRWAVRRQKVRCVSLSEE